MNKSKTIIITLIVTGFVVLTLLVVSVILAYNKSIDNQELKNKKLKVVIYQYHLNSTDKQEYIYKSFSITNETIFSDTVYALDKEDDYNNIYIKDGVIKVTESNCYNHNCMHMIIDINNKDFSLLNPNTTTIECRPHGLKIILEEDK